VEDWVEGQDAKASKRSATKEPLRKTTVYLPPALSDRLAVYCARRRVSITNVLRRYIEELLAKEPA
jgi:hypothetical protein